MFFKLKIVYLRRVKLKFHLPYIVICSENNRATTDSPRIERSLEVECSLFYQIYTLKKVYDVFNL